MPDRSASLVIDRPTVGLCAGKDCRKRCEFVQMRDALAKKCEVVELKCVGICSGCVVVANPRSSDPTVYSKLRTKKHRRHLLRVVVDEKRPSSELAKRKVGGSKRTATLRRVGRRLKNAS